MSKYRYWYCQHALWPNSSKVELIWQHFDISHFVTTLSKEYTKKIKQFHDPNTNLTLHTNLMTCVKFQHFYHFCVKNCVQKSGSIMFPHNQVPKWIIRACNRNIWKFAPRLSNAIYKYAIFMNTYENSVILDVILIRYS